MTGRQASGWCCGEHGEPSLLTCIDLFLNRVYNGWYGGEITQKGEIGKK